MCAAAAPCLPFIDTPGTNSSGFIELFAPEYKTFNLSDAGSGNCSSGGKAVHGLANSMADSLQACLLNDWCGHVLYRPSSKTASLCESLSFGTGEAPSTCLVLADRAKCHLSTSQAAADKQYALSETCRVLDGNGICQCGPGLHAINPLPWWVGGWPLSQG